MYGKLFLVLVASLFGSSCSSDSEPTQTNDYFNISVKHVASVKAGEPFTITMTPSQGNVISSSSIENKTMLSPVIKTDSASSIEVLIPTLYENETFFFSVTVTNQEGESITIESEVDILLNQKPSITSANVIGEINNGKVFDIEVIAEDEDGIASYDLLSDVDGVVITQQAVNSFTVNVNSTEAVDSIQLTAIATDNFGQSSSFVKTIKLTNSESIQVMGASDVFVASESPLWIELTNFDDVTIENVEWSQTSGEDIVFSNASNDRVTITWPSENTETIIGIEAAVTLSSGDIYTLQKNVNVIKNLSHSFTIIEPNKANELIQSHIQELRSPKIDINQDGIVDDVIIDKGMIQLRISKEDGSFGDFESAGKITFHQWTTTGYYESSETIRRGMNAEALKLIDVDGDGFKDLIFQARSDCDACNGNALGWIRAVNESSTFFSGDYLYFYDEANSWLDNLIDLNGDNVKELITVDSYTAFYGPNIHSIKPDNTINASYICCNNRGLNQGLILKSEAYLRDINNDGKKELLTLQTDKELWDLNGKTWLLIQSFNSDTNQFEPAKTIFFNDNKVNNLIVLDANSDHVNDILLYVDMEYQLITIENL